MQFPGAQHEGAFQSFRHILRQNAARDLQARLAQAAAGAARAQTVWIFIKNAQNIGGKPRADIVVGSKARRRHEGALLAAILPPHMLIQQMQIGPVIGHFVVAIGPLDHCLQAFEIEAAQILKIGHDNAQQSARPEDATAIPQQTARFVPLQMLQHMRGIDRIGHALTKGQRLADVERPDFGRGGPVIEIDPIGMPDASAADVDQHRFAHRSVRFRPNGFRLGKQTRTTPGFQDAAPVTCA